MNDTNSIFCTNNKSEAAREPSAPFALLFTSSNKFVAHDNPPTERNEQVDFSRSEAYHNSAFPPPLPTLAAAYTRVAMTTSMQKAYAIMRGTSDTSAGSSTGPLQDTLFARQDRESHSAPLHFLPDNNTRAQLMESLQELTSLWWDPLVTSRYTTDYIQTLEKSADQDVHFENLFDDPSDISDGDEMSPRHIVSNKGDDRPSQDNKTSVGGPVTYQDAWSYVDPNSSFTTTSHELSNELSSPPRSYENKEVAVRANIEHFSYEPQALTYNVENNILTEEEYKRLSTLFTEEFDNEFEQYGNHSNHTLRELGFDREGRFEDARITPAQFAALAVGVSSEGSRYSTKGTEVPSQPKRDRAPQGSRIAVIPTQPPAQYDEDDGTAMSGIFEEDSNPSVQESPRGFSLNDLPAQLQQTLPGIFDKLHITHYEATHNIPSLLTISPTLPPPYSLESPSNSAHTPPLPTFPPSPHPTGLSKIYTDDLIFTSLGTELYYSTSTELEALNTTYHLNNQRTASTLERRREIFERKEYLRLMMVQLKKILTQAGWKVDIENGEDRKKHSSQGRGQPAPQPEPLTKGVFSGRTLRRSIGRIEDLLATRSPSPPLSPALSPLPNTTTKEEQRNVEAEEEELQKEIVQHLELEKRRMKACIARQEEVEKRLVEEIYEGIAACAEMERVRRRVWGVVEGTFGLVESH